MEIRETEGARAGNGSAIGKIRDEDREGMKIGF